MKKKKINEIVVNNIPIEMLGNDMSLDKVFDYFGELLMKYPDGRLEWDERWDSDRQANESYLFVTNEREETDEEYYSRLEREAKEKRQEEERELLQLAYLKHKYKDHPNA